MFDYMRYCGRWQRNLLPNVKTEAMHMQFTSCLRKMAMKVVVFGLLLFLLAADVFARRESAESERRGRKRRSEQEKFTDLQPRKPREVFRSEGGRIESYDAEDYQAMCDAEFGVKRLTVEPNGLVLPAYKDVHVLLSVVEGKVRAGIVSPFSDKITERSVFDLREGDAMAIPRGFAAWILNDGDRRAQIIDYADTTSSNQCGNFEVFHLAGGDEESSRDSERECSGKSLLHGFSRELLAHAWDVDESMVQRVLEGQKGSRIIKVDEQQRKQLPPVTNSGIYMDFVYRVGDAQPDVYVPRGGELRQLSSLKLPILKQLGLSGSCYKLKSGALTAPSWTHNAHKLVYVTRGRGRVEVARENGEQAVDAELEEGMVMVIPANFPSAKLAGDEGLEFGVIYKTHVPIESFLAGRNSVYKGIPSSVISTSFQIDEKLQQKMEQRRTEEAYIFPPRHEGRKHSTDSFHFVENLVRVFA